MLIKCTETSRGPVANIISNYPVTKTVLNLKWNWFTFPSAEIPGTLQATQTVSFYSYSLNDL